MSLWYEESFADRVRFGLRVTDILFREQTAYQLVEVVDTVHFGRALVIDGVWMTSQADEHYYHEMLVQPAACTAPSLRRVLIIGGGDGGTARQVLLHPEVERVDLVEIDGKVIDACRRHLPDIGAWDDPRLQVTIGDGIAFVRDEELAPYDLILLDGTDPVGAAEGLFDASFFGDARSRLAPEGVFALQTETPTYYRQTLVDTVRRLRGLFPHVHPYVGAVPLYASGMWTFTYASNADLHLALVRERVERAEAVTRYYNGEIHRAAFALPNELRRELAP
jgi:spermidine synthase